MNYRHSYHAGNFADVVKHVVLSLVIAHLRGKETPFRVIDTHAGCGLYDLAGGEARKTGEWRDGIGRLALSNNETLRGLLSHFLDVVAAFNRAGELERYPGSPLIALQLMRAGDRLLANELHQGERAALAAVLGRDRRAKVLGLNGYTVLKSVLPPRERRGVVLIDPPFEIDDEFGRLVRALKDGIRRFATGIYIVWYPVKDKSAVARFKREIVALGIPKVLNLELEVGGVEPSGAAKKSVAPDKKTGVEGAHTVNARGPGLSAAGLLIVNPPFPLLPVLEQVMPELQKVLARGRGAGYRLEWLVEEHAS